MRKIVLSSGHGSKISGAVDIIDEHDEAVRVVDRTAEYLRRAGVECITYEDTVSTTQDENLERIVSFHNAQGPHDLDVSVHFNSNGTTSKPIGTEVFYGSDKELAAKTSAAIADAGNFIDRGAKDGGTEFYFCRNTIEKALLLEICFVNSQVDVELYEQNFDFICKAIAGAIAGEAEQPAGAVSPALKEEDQAAICRIANSSAIASYAWKDRGIAPKGYTQGMALAFAQTYRKLLVGHGAALAMAAARTDSDKDALNIYREEFDAMLMSNETSGADTLRHLYALMLGHGMRESSGVHCEGRDMSADNVGSDTAEAGLFQTSYNAHTASDPHFDNLMDEYSEANNEATCYYDAFAENVTCGNDDWDNYGGGEGYDFQKLCKSCPAFAVETAALTLRNLANHYGPIVRMEVELRHEADDLFRAVARYVDARTYVA